MSKLLAAVLAVLLFTQAAASSRSLTQLQQPVTPFGPSSSTSASTTSSSSNPPNRPAWLQLLQQLLQGLGPRPNAAQQAQSPARPTGILGFLLSPLAGRPTAPPQQQPGGAAVTPTALTQPPRPTKPEPTGIAKQPPPIVTLPNKGTEQKPTSPTKPGKEPLQKPEPSNLPGKQPSQKPSKPSPSKPSKGPKPAKGPNPTPTITTTARPPSNTTTARPLTNTVKTTAAGAAVSPSNTSTAADNDTCVIPAARLQSFEVSVEATAEVQLQQGEGVFGYFSHTFADCDPSNSTLCSGSSPGQRRGVYQNGYCIDTKRSIRTNRTYNVASFSSYSPIADMKCPDAAPGSTTPLNPNITSTTLRQLNWLVNTYYNPSFGVNETCVLEGPVAAGDYQSLNATAAGVYGPPSSNDMQAAIWTISGNVRNAGNITSNNDVVNCLAANALRSRIAATYTPPCGATVAVVLVPCDLEMVRTDNQIMISQVPVDCEC